jgi:hypothetical protein
MSASKNATSSEPGLVNRYRVPAAFTCSTSSSPPVPLKRVPTAGAPGSEPRSAASTTDLAAAAVSPVATSRPTNALRERRPS